MIYWKLVYAALQFLAMLIPALQKGRGVDMHPLDTVMQMHALRRKMADIDRNAGTEQVTLKPVDESPLMSKRKFR